MVILKSCEGMYKYTNIDNTLEILGHMNERA